MNNATLACERALAIDPKLSQAHICLGTAYTNTGRYDDAIQQFRQAVASESTNDDAVRGLGVAFEKAKRFAEAENTFRAAIRLRPHYWANYNLLGAFYWRRGRYDEAAKVDASAPLAFGDDVPSLEAAERSLIVAALRKTGGNKNQAARMLGIDRQRLYRKLEKYHLE